MLPTLSNLKPGLVRGLPAVRGLRHLRSYLSSWIYANPRRRVCKSLHRATRQLFIGKRYIDDNALKLGDEVELEDLVTEQRKALNALVELGKKRGPLEGIANPVAWLRSQRASSDPWDEVNHRDSSRQ